MKNRFKSLIVGALAISGALMLNGCGEDAVVQGHGAIAMKIGVDSHVINNVESRGDFDTLLGDITADQLKIKLEHESGKHTFSFKSADDFPTAYKFPIGKYAVVASYGTVDEEGIDKPAFEGKADIEVFTNDVTPVDLTATLANCILQVDYTSGFKVYMKDYYCELNSSSGKKYTVPELDEEGTLFFKPGSTSVTVNFVRPDGKPGTVTLPQFDAEPQHIYKVTFDIDAQFGVAVLNVTFNDKKISEVQPIDLSKDIDVIPAPFLVARGFDATKNTPIDFIENVPYNNELDIQVIAMGGLQSVKLITESRALCLEKTDGLLFPKEIELIGVSDENKELLNHYGLEVFGLWSKPDQMGIVDFGTILKSIRYISDTDLTSFTVVATDRFGRESDPMTLNLKPIKLELSLASTNGTEFQLGMYEEIAHVHVRYNGGVQFADQLKFEYTDANGNWVPTTVTEVQQTPPSSISTGNDKYQLCAFVKVPSSHEDLKIHAHCGNKVSNDVDFKRVGSYMYFDQTYDPDRLNTFATRTKVHLNMGVIDRSSIEIYARKRGEGDDAWKLMESTPVAQASVAATVTVSGLEPNSMYELKAQAKKTMAGEEGEILETADVFEVQTEKSRQIEDETEISRFDIWREVGAFHQKTNYWVTRVGQDYIARYFIGNGNNPIWKTRNELTTGQTSGDTPYYTSLSSTVPVSNGSGHAAEISAVGYGGGSTFTVGGGGNCRRRISGIMFLGDYFCDGEDPDTEVITYGIPFDTRPSGLKFQYKFKSNNGESFRVFVSIEHREADGSVVVLSSNELVSNENVTDFTEYTIPLSYQDSPLKATHITVSFLASTNEFSPSFTAVQASGDNVSNGYSNSKRIGNVLTIDDVELIY